MTAPRRTWIFLALGLLAASQSGNIIRLGDTHPVAIAAWRLAIASVLLAPLAGRGLATLGSLSRRDAGLLVVAGVVLAAHFVTWIAAVQRTTVANAAIFFSVNPVLTSAASWAFFRERPGPRLLVAIALGLVGVAAIGAGDLTLDPSHAAGDALAVACSVLFTAYFLIGKRLRRTLSSRVYVTALYGVAGLAGFACMAAMGIPATGYDGSTWLCFLLMALVPTMIGHTSFNHALRYVPAGTISAATLTEPLLAGLVAAFAWGEEVSAPAIAGYALICASVLVLVPNLWPSVNREP
jgi:drug/metabolite transporter (DMT)-like permease